MRKIRWAAGHVLLVGGVAMLAACGSSSSSGVDSGTSGDSGHKGTDAGHGKDTGTTKHDTGSPAKDTGAPKDTGKPSDGGGVCASYAAAQCAYLSACEPGTLDTTYGSSATCVATVEANCTRNLTVPGTGFTASFPAACGSLLQGYATACASGPVPRPVPATTACTIVGTGSGGAPCGLNVQCATAVCDSTGSTCGRCSTGGAAGTPCGPGTGVTCNVGLSCGNKDICVTVVDKGAPCDRGVTNDCTAGTGCVISTDAGTPDGGPTGTCQPLGVKTGTACNPTSVGAPNCWAAAGFFCSGANTCQPITYGASGACGEVDGGTADNGCSNGVCFEGTCAAHAAVGASCTVAAGQCVAGAVCVDSDGGASGTCTALDTMCGADAGLAPFTFSPSNISLSTIYQYASQAADENIAQSTSFATQATGTSVFDPGFTSPIEQVMQSDGVTQANLIVVKSLTVPAGTTITVTGAVPLIIVSLGDINIMGNIAANATGALDGEGPGGAPESAADTAGGGPGGGPAASGSMEIGAGGGSYCALGGFGGNGTVQGKRYGNLALRPLLGGSAGGGGVVGGGAGGGGLQLVAAGTLTVASASYLSVSGNGGLTGGVPQANQNAGGGGSGGGLLLEAPTVTVLGTLTSNGGGGGGANVGADGTVNNATPAAGSAGSGTQGAGGNGGAGATVAGTDGKTIVMGTAGGGGGSAGRIRINSSTGTASVMGTASPALTGTACGSEGDLRSLADGP